MSISTWIRFSSLPANGAPAQLLIGRSNAYALLVVADNSAFRFQFSYFNILQKSSITIAVNTWYHVVGTYDAKSTSTKASIFINGSNVILFEKYSRNETVIGVLSSLSNAMQASATVNDVIGDIIIGPMQQNLLVATLDDLRLYNVVLTAADALNDMNTPVTPSLIGAYSFDNTTPTSGLIDSSLYANHGAAVQVSNCAQTVAGRFGTAVRFNGVWRCSFAVDAAQYRLFGSMSFAAWLSPISFPQDDGDIISV